MSEPASPVHEAAGPSGDPVRLRDGLRTCVAVFVALRLALFAVSAFGIGAMDLPPDQPTDVPGWPARVPVSGAHDLFTATERQDALWFLRIATEGYRDDDGSAAFFPLYPIAVRAVTWVPGVGPLAASLLVSNAAGFAALLVFHGLTRREFGDAALADRATRYFAAIPTSFFLLAPYSESLFLLLSLLAFWWARPGRWPAAAAAGLGAGLTRAIGAALAAPIAWEALRRRAAGAPAAARIGAPAAPATALAVVAGFWWWRAREPLAPLHAQSAWRPEATVPWGSLARGIEDAFRFGGWWAVDAAFVAGAVVLLAIGARRIRAPYLLYGATSLVVPLLAVFPSRPFLSIPRFCAVIFPLAWPLARLAGRSRWIDLPLLGLLAIAWVMLAVAFVNWQYIF